MIVIKTYCLSLVANEWHAAFNYLGCFWQEDLFPLIWCGVGVDDLFCIDDHRSRALAVSLMMLPASTNSIITQTIFSLVYSIIA